MKSSTLQILIFSILIIGSYGCSDNGPTNTEPTINPPSAEAFNALRDAAMDSRTQTAQFNAEDGISFTSQNGVDLTIPDGCLALDGQDVSGVVTLEYAEIFDKSDMLVTNKPTMGLASTGDKKTLVSGGEFFINVSQNGNVLEPSCSSSQLKIPYELTSGIDTDMKLWQGSINSSGNLTWIKANQEATTENNNGGIIFERENYYAPTKKFGFINLDHFSNDPRPKTTLKVQPPKGYDVDNSAVYLSYDGEENSLTHLDQYDFGEGIFREHNGDIPLGVEMHVIFVTEDNGQWRYAIQGVTVADNDLYTFTFGETVLGSEQDLIDAIKALP